MILILGGAYQGKTDFARAHFAKPDDEIEVCTENLPTLPEARLLTHLERFVLGCVRRGEDPAAHFGDMKSRVLIVDDLSCGLVPMEAEKRAWREQNGRLCRFLAGEADEVWRVFCGLGQRLK